MDVERGLFMRAIIIFAGILFVSGCAAMSKDECLYADWQAVGYEDGAAGNSVSAVSSRRTACAKKAGVTLDMAAYSRGRDQGLTVFCQPAKGYALGVHGGAYHGVCSGPVEAAFIDAFETGRQLYNLERNVASIEARLRQAHYDARAAEHGIAEIESALISTKTSNVQRLELLAEYKHLAEEKGNIETAVIALNRDHVRAEEELAEYRDFLTYNEFYTRGTTTPSQASY